MSALRTAPATNAGRRALDQLAPLLPAADPTDERAVRNERAQVGRRAVLLRLVIAIEDEAVGDAAATLQHIHDDADYRLAAIEAQYR